MDVILTDAPWQKATAMSPYLFIHSFAASNSSSFRSRCALSARKSLYIIPTLTIAGMLLCIWLIRTIEFLSREACVL